MLIRIQIIITKESMELKLNNLLNYNPCLTLTMLNILPHFLILVVVIRCGLGLALSFSFPL
jgi:hypothetical protein